MHDFVDETYRQMTLLLPVFVIIAALYTVLLGWNDNFSSGIPDRVEKMLCIIQTIGNLVPVCSTVGDPQHSSF